MIGLCSLFISYMKMYCLLVYIDAFSCLFFFFWSCFPAEPAFGRPGKTYLYSYQTYPSACVKATLSATRATWRYGQLSISRLPSPGFHAFPKESVRRRERGASAREGARVEVSEEDDQHGGVAIEEQRSSGLGMF